MKKLFAWFLPKSWREGFFGGLIVVFLVTVGWMALLDRNPSTNVSWEILTPVVRQGDNFRISYDLEWRSPCRIIGMRFIVDGAGYRHERIYDARYVEEGPASFVIGVPVPPSAAPGQAEYRGELEYACNIWQRVFPLRRTITARPFEIIPADPNSSGRASPATLTFTQLPHVR